MADAAPRHAMKAIRYLRDLPAPIRVALWYALFSFAWIAITDLIVARLIDDEYALTFVQTAKGWIFVAASTIVISMVGMVEYRRHSSIASRFADLHGTSPVAISIATLDEGRLLEVNPEFLRMFGYEPGEVVGRTAPELGIWTDNDERTKTLETLRKEKALRNVEATFRRGDGTTFDAMWSGHVVEMNGRECILAFTLDITDAKEDERRIAAMNVELEARLSRLRSLQEISEAIIGSTDLQHMLSVITDQVERQLGVDAVGVLLYRPGTQMLEHVAGQGFRSKGSAESRLRVGEGRAGEAALKREAVHVPDLSAPSAGFVRSQLARDEGFVSYYVVPLVAKGELKGVLEAFTRTPLDATRGWSEVAEELARHTAIAIDNAQMFDGLSRSNLELQLSHDRTIEGWARALDLRDETSVGHSQRVTDLTLELGRALGLNGERLANIRRGALLHDIGMMGVPDHILQKPGPLTDDERARMQRHTTYARDLLTGIPYLENAMGIPYSHHERWDGTGYPQGLQGERIPMGARIFAVVDVFDALTNDRPYRDAWPREQALAHIEAEAGKHFDPRIVEAFMAMQSDAGNTSRPN